MRVFKPKMHSLSAVRRGWCWGAKYAVKDYLW